MLFEENKTLAPFTTFQIGGPARWLATAGTEEEVVEAIGWAREKRLGLFVLGGGSNLLISDAGFDGLVLRIGISGVEANRAPDQSCQVTYRVGAGEDWDSFVSRTVSENCAGLECLAGIPGTVGGTPVQNVGAYGQEVATTIDRVRAFDLKHERFVELTLAECGFAYRRSRFNTTDRERFVVTHVDYRLTEGGSPSLRYAELQRAFSEGAKPTLSDVSAMVRQIRRSKGMLIEEGVADCRSAGSFFKNPIVNAEELARIEVESGKMLPRFPAGPGSENAGCAKVPAAWLIEQAGFAKGYAMGPAGISTLHTLALVNCGSATAHDILALADRIRSSVEQRFGIHLEMEPVLVGF